MVRESEMRTNGQIREVLDSIDKLNSKLTMAGAEIDRIFTNQAVTVSYYFSIHDKL